MCDRLFYLQEQVDEYELIKTIAQSFKDEPRVPEMLDEIDANIKKLKIAIEVAKIVEKTNINR